jgi:hypothetical protein
MPLLALTLFQAGKLCAMAKKDLTTNIEIKREDADQRAAAEANSSSGMERGEEKTVVKNAHATGLGAIGRNDQKISKEKSDPDNY